jgi:hypothetical protein
VIFKPIEIVDFRRQLKEFGLPERTIQHLSPLHSTFAKKCLSERTMSSKPSMAVGERKSRSFFASARGQPRPAHFLCGAQEMSESQILGASPRSGEQTG